MKKYLFSSLIVFSSLFLTACTVKNPSSNSTGSDNEIKETSSSFSLRQLISQNIPQKCTYTGANQDGSFESEIIISGKKFNQIIKTKSPEGEQTINSVSDGDYIYTWGSHVAGGTFAIKLKADFDTQTTPTINQDKSASQEIAESQVDLDTNYQGKCSPTIVTDVNFQPPKDIKFEDYSKFLDDLKSSIPSINPKDLE